MKQKIFKMSFSSVLLSLNLSITAHAVNYDFGQSAKMSPVTKLHNRLGFNLERTNDLVLTSRNPHSILKTEVKRSIRLLNPEKDQALFNELGLTLEFLNQKLNQNKATLNQYYFIANFIDGFKPSPESETEFSEDVQYWIMIIPKTVKITDLYYQHELFGEGAGAHAQLRFKLNSNILLVDQENQKTSKLIPGDLVYTLLAVRSSNGPQKWEPVSGLLGEFANAYALFSTSHIALTTNQKNIIEQYPLDESKMTAEFSFNSVFNGILNFSNEKKETEIYNTVFNSCVTAVMRALYFQGFEKVNLDIFNPYSILSHFKENGYIKDQSPLPTLNEEYKNIVPNTKFELKNESNAKVVESVELAMPLIVSQPLDLLLRFLAQEIIAHELKIEEVKFLFTFLKSRPHLLNLESELRTEYEQISDSNLKNQIRMNTLLKLINNLNRQLENSLKQVTQEHLKWIDSITRLQ